MKAAVKKTRIRRKASEVFQFLQKLKRGIIRSPFFVLNGTGGPVGKKRDRYLFSRLGKRFRDTYPWKERCLSLFSLPPNILSITDFSSATSSV